MNRLHKSSSIVRVTALAALLLMAASASAQGPMISFAVPANNSVKGRAFENQSPLAVAVQLSAPSNTPVTVQYGTSNGTAMAGVNYGPVAGTVVFPPGSILQNIYIPMIDDHVIDPVLYGNISLNHPQGGTLNPADSSGQFAIYDADGPPPTLQLSSSSYVVNESGGNVTITAELSRPWFTAITCQVASGGGSALPNIDYTPIASGTTLTFPEWTTTVSFEIAIVDNHIPAPELIFYVGISNITVAGPGSPLAAEVTILPDQPLPAAAVVPNPVYLLRSDTATINAYTSPVDDVQYLTYESENEGVATVSGSGGSATVTGMAPGVVVIDAYVGGRFWVASTTVYVEGVTVSPNPILLTPGGTVTLTATTEQSEDDVQYVTYDCANPEIATVPESGGSVPVRAVSPGATSIDVYFNGYWVTSVDVYVVSQVSLSPNPVVLLPNDSVTLTATANAPGAAQYLDYECENTDIADVEPSGSSPRVTAGDVGPTQIDVYFGGNYFGSVPVYVLGLQISPPYSPDSENNPAVCAGGDDAPTEAHHRITISATLGCSGSQTLNLQGYSINFSTAAGSVDSPGLTQITVTTSTNGVASTTLISDNWATGSLRSYAQVTAAIESLSAQTQVDFQAATVALAVPYPDIATGDVAPLVASVTWNDQGVGGHELGWGVSEIVNSQGVVVYDGGGPPPLQYGRLEHGQEQETTSEGRASAGFKTGRDPGEIAIQVKDDSVLLFPAADKNPVASAEENVRKRTVKITRRRDREKAEYEPIERAVADVLPGEYIDLQAVLEPPAKPALASYRWAIPGDIFKDYTASHLEPTKKGSGLETPKEAAQRVAASPCVLTPVGPEDCTRADGKMQYYWSDTWDDRRIVVKTTRVGNDDVEFVADTHMNVKRPQVSYRANKGGVYLATYDDEGPLLALAKGPKGDQLYPGIESIAAVQVPKGFDNGEWYFGQMVAMDWYTVDMLAGQKLPATGIDSHGIKCSDRHWPYPMERTKGSGSEASGEAPQDLDYKPTATGKRSRTAEDSPFFHLVKDEHEFSVQEWFSTYVMFKPKGSLSQYVPLERLDWRWVARATVTGGREPQGEEAMGFVFNKGGGARGVEVVPPVVDSMHPVWPGVVDKVFPVAPIKDN